MKITNADVTHINLLMPGGNKKVAHKAASLFKYV